MKDTTKMVLRTGAQVQPSRYTSQASWREEDGMGNLTSKDPIVGFDPMILKS